MAEWSQEIPTGSSIDLPPDPRALDALGRNHSLETAIADLVDNAIDAGASHVLIQLVKVRGRLRTLYVVDNGRGMTPESIDTAMTVGGQREYGKGDLGHFGLGLKAASFSQARSLTVMSRAAGHEAVGRRWRLNRVAQRGFACDVLPGPFVEEEVNRGWRIPSTGAGTVIRWDDIVAFPDTDDLKRVETFISHTVTTACQHLGMVFHRFLQDDRLAVDFEIYDADTALTGPSIPVTPLDPFGYSRSGRTDFPQTFDAQIGDLRIAFRCHLWPGRSSTSQFRLSGNPIDHQGLYFYRRDRLLQAGGWLGVYAPHRRLQLARVEVDIDNDVVGMFQMNPEKSRVLVGPEFARLAAAARSPNGASLGDYFDIAEQVFKTSNVRSAKRAAMIHPGAGLPPRVRATIQREVPAIRGEQPIDIRWSTFTDDLFFQVDREERILWLNKRYRKLLLGGKHGGLNDLPLLKSLLYLLLENTFEGDYLGSRDKDNIDLWQTILTAAVQAERQ
ncbi:ATP-binding protein [Micromonospora sp. NPDC005189]|uniref:ATP-binding protein n=1 Tax=Micromonospora sp. NPDC005189 TaxID=3157019 RepID=UPI0033B62187